MSPLLWIAKVQKVKLKAKSLPPPEMQVQLRSPAQLFPSLTVAYVYSVFGEIMCNGKTEILIKLQ